jgi:hypothetical protein
MVKEESKQTESPPGEIVKKKRGRKPNPDKKKENRPSKKRGRKPNPNKVLEQKIPKKRGRKPKAKYEVVEEHKINICNEEQVILHLPSSISNNFLDEDFDIDSNDLMKYNPTISNPKPYSDSNIYESVENLEAECEKQIFIKINNIKEKNIHNSKDIDMNIEISNVTNDLIDDIKIDPSDTNYINYIKNQRTINIKDSKSDNNMIFFDFVTANNNGEWPTSVKIACLWCTECFTNSPYGIPIKFFNEKYQLYGNFCSAECAAAYNFDNFSDEDNVWEYYSLLNHIYGGDREIKLAPPRLALKKFGGKLLIGEFRECNQNYTKTYQVTKPPFISVIPTLEEVIINNNCKNKSNYVENSDDYRLKRNKPLPNYKNTLDSCMNLKIV